MLTDFLGTPINATNQAISSTEAFDISEMAAELPKHANRLDIREVSAGAVVDGRGQPYCPVFIAPKADGGRTFTAYIQDEIMDVDDYVDLIDTLITATEKDDYYIYIDSPGGRISAGSIISSVIHHSRANVYTVARGLCASAACLIHNAAKAGHAIVDDMGVLMIHMSLHGDTGCSTLIQKRAADQVRYVNTNLLKQALDMGYLLPDELASIQNGNEIFISKKDFDARLAAKQDHTEAPAPTSSTQAEVMDDPVAATEDFDVVNKLTSAPQMGAAIVITQQRMLKANALRIRTCDNKNFRVYIPSDLVFSRTFVSNLCRFMDCRKEGESITLILGAKLVDETASIVGAIVSAMRHCKATVITVAAGYASVPETLLWCFGHKRAVMRYGALSFGITDLVKRVPKYKDYFEVFLKRALEIGILQQQDVEDILEHGSTKFLVYDDVKQINSDFAM